MGYMSKYGYEPYYLYRQGYMAGDLENIGCAHKGAEGMYNIQIMEEHQTIIGIGGAATSKVGDFKNKRMKSSFNAKDLVTYLRDIDIYIEKRRALLDAACAN
jgi:oxygen-independent coproporphyrinogen-3 oxidase